MRVRSWRFCLALVSVCLAGTVLRLHQLRDQILLNDEWHSLEFVLGHGLGHLSTHFSVPGASSIPLNVYNLLLLETWGWSELPLRLPALVPGLLTPLLLPLSVRRIVGDTAALLYAAMLAVSPLLVFYTRDARPYGMVTLLAFAGLLAAWRWLSFGERRSLLAYVLLAASAAYFHQFAAILALAPLAYAAGARLFQRRAAGCGLPAWRQLAGAGCALSLLIAPLAVAFSGSVGSDRMGADRITLSTLWNLVHLVCGTSSPLWIAVFLGLVAVGVVSLARRSSALLGTLGTAFGLYALALWVVRPNGVHAALVVARYGIALLPAWTLFAALGLGELAERVRAIPVVGRGALGRGAGLALAALFPVALFASGPLRATWERPNNFTNHHEFQETYTPIDWRWSHVSEIHPGFGTLVSRDEVPSFYERLAREPGRAAIIEYPMMLGDHFNDLYFFQHVHRKPVIVGYAPVLPYDDPGSRGFIVSDMIVDEVLGRVRDPRRLKFRNMVDITSAEAVEHSGARYLVLHRPHPRRPEIAPIFTRAVEYYTARWRKAPLVDGSLVVFEIPAGPAWVPG